MHKYAKLTTAAMLGALIMGAATGCGGKADLIFWSGFGSSYTTAVNSLVDRYKAVSGVSIDNQTQGSYDKLQSNLNNSISTASYPNFTHGYPDHFAGYIKSSIQLPLDNYIKAYDAAHGTDLMKDYYAPYMKENMSLMYDAQGNPYVMGLPFNKSTEVMGYNGYFMDYALKQDSTLKVPETWQELMELGPKFMAVMETLYEKNLYGIPTTEDPEKFSAYAVGLEAPSPDYEQILDCTKVTKDKFKLMCWDSTDNMFITIVRQWGGVYTSYSSEDAKKYGHGWAEFYTGENANKTKAALQAFKDLYDKDYFGLPGDISDDSYSSTGFKNNQTMFTICSSGGLSYNISTTRFKLAPIPYNVIDGKAQKYVISQGTNLALLDQGTDVDKQKAFDAMVGISTGDLQASFAVETGYYPACETATKAAAYQNLLNNKQENPTQRAYQESAVLNENYYMKESEGWEKFVDPGFSGSSAIRAEVKTIMAIVFAGEKDFDTILSESYERIKAYTHEGQK